MLVETCGARVAHELGSAVQTARPVSEVTPLELAQQCGRNARSGGNLIQRQAGRAARSPHVRDRQPQSWQRFDVSRWRRLGFGTASSLDCLASQLEELARADTKVGQRETLDRRGKAGERLEGWQIQRSERSGNGEPETARRAKLRRRLETRQQIVQQLGGSLDYWAIRVDGTLGDNAAVVCESNDVRGRDAPEATLFMLSADFNDDRCCFSWNQIERRQAVAR